MDAERIREFLLSLPHVVETMQFGNNLVFWLGDKAIGGKMFVLVDLDDGKHGQMMFRAGPERYAALLELEGLYPAPYMARAYWVATQRWDVFRRAEWENELRAAHALTLARLPPKTLKALALPSAQLKRLVKEKTAILAAKKKQSGVAK